MKEKEWENNSEKERNNFDAFNQIDGVFKEKNTSNKPLLFLLECLVKKGFCDKHNQADVPRFYKYARIGADVWSSSIMSNSHKPSHDTMLKIVIALKFDEKEARELMSYWGDGFSMASPRDNLILATIQCGYNNAEDVYDIIEYYRENARNGKKDYPQLYRE